MRMFPCWVLGVALVACEPMPPTGDPLAPVAISAPVPAGAPAAPAGEPSPLDDDEAWSDAEIEAATRKADADASDPIARQARLMGVPVPDAPPPAPEVPVEAPVAAPALAPALPTLPATPTVADFGVRLVQVLADVYPPRAVLGLADGSEIVVQPGAFVDAHRLVVLAIGKDAVQVVRVLPEGYYARIEPVTLTPLFGVPGR